MNILTERITRHPAFRDMKPGHLDILAHHAKETAFETGQVLFVEGGPADRLYLVESGRVALEACEPVGEPTLVQIVGAGELLGWSWLFPPFAWHFQGRAIEPTRAIALSGAHLLIAAERDHEFGYELMKRVAKVVISRLQATRKQMTASQEESAAWK